tara:strand:- start:343 stop:1101 length:759 start_codon:yes stop_codon:yes gene_type:complete
MNDKTSIEYLIDKIKKNSKIAFLRFGDGDFQMMFKQRVGTMVGHSNQNYVTSEMNKEMLDSYNYVNDNYLIGDVYGSLSDRNTLSNVKNMIKIHKNEPFCKKDNNLSYICIQESFLTDSNNFLEFVNVINKSKTVFVGSYYEPILDKFYGNIVYHVKTPSTNSANYVDELEQEILEIDTPYEQIIFSAGQASRLLIYRLWKKLNVKFIDVGSVSDMIIINSQSFKKIKKRSHLITYKDLIKKNLDFYNQKLN